MMPLQTALLTFQRHRPTMPLRQALPPMQAPPPRQSHPPLRRQARQAEPALMRLQTALLTFQRHRQGPAMSFLRQALPPRPVLAVPAMPPVPFHPCRTFPASSESLRRRHRHWNSQALGPAHPRQALPLPLQRLLGKRKCRRQALPPKELPPAQPWPPPSLRKALPPPAKPPRRLRHRHALTPSQ